MGFTALSKNQERRKLVQPASWMKSAALVLALFGLLALAIGGAGYTWFAIGDADMSADGYAALIIGVVFSLIVGCGLMALVFYSSRRGHDEPPKVDNESRV